MASGCLSTIRFFFILREGMTRTFKFTFRANGIAFFMRPETLNRNNVIGEMNNFHWLVVFNGCFTPLFKAKAPPFILRY